MSSTELIGTVSSTNISGTISFSSLTGTIGLASIGGVVNPTLSGVGVYVPYTGCLKNVDLGSFNFTTTGTVTAGSFVGILADGVTATTQSSDDNSTKVATTEYVDTAVEGENIWDRTGTTLSPHNVDDDIVMNGDITNNSLTTGYVNFDLTATPSTEEGRMCWNDDDGTLNLGMPGGNVNLQIGQELLIRAKNTSGGVIPNGAAVYVSGASGSKPTIGLANATIHQVANATIAVATEEISDNSFGYVTAFGLVRDIDTSMATDDGMPLFLSTIDGVLTNTLPTQPNSQVFIGVCLRKHASEGILFVKVIPQPNIDELSNVLISSVSDRDILSYDSATTTWQNVSASSFSDVYVPYTGASSIVDLNTQILRQDSNGFRYFGDNDETKIYFDGDNNFHVEPSNFVGLPTPLQILFNDSGDIYDGNKIQDSSGNNYDAELEGSNVAVLGGHYGFDVDNISIPNTRTTVFWFKRDVNSGSDAVVILNMARFHRLHYASGSNLIYPNDVGGHDSYIRFHKGYFNNLLDWTFFGLKSDADGTEALISNIDGSTEEIVSCTQNPSAKTLDGINKSLYVPTNFKMSLNSVWIYDETLSLTELRELRDKGSVTGKTPFKQFVFSGGTLTQCYEVVDGATYSVSRPATTGNDYYNSEFDTDSQYSYNIKYGFRNEPSGEYVPYQLDGTPMGTGGTLHPAGAWHNNCETKIILNPDDVADITTAIGATSSDSYSYADLYDYWNSTGDGDFTLDEVTNQKSNMRTYATKVRFPASGFEAHGQLHTPTAQFSNKSRGDTSSTYNLKLLNNDGTVLVGVKDDGKASLKDIEVESLSVKSGDTLLYTANVADAFFVDHSEDRIYLNTNLHESYYNATSNGYVVGTNYEVVAWASGSCLSMFLPNAVNKAVYTVVNTLATDLILGTSDAGTINGSFTISIPQDYSVTIICDGVDWKIISTGCGTDELINFSYETINEPLTIPENQQMIVMGEFNLNAELVLNGELVLEV